MTGRFRHRIAGLVALVVAGMVHSAPTSAPAGAQTASPDLPASCGSDATEQREACAQQLYELGAAALAQREPAQALTLLSASLQRSDDPVTRADLGRALLALQRYEQAREQFQRALDSDPPPEARALLLRFLDLAQQERTQTRGLQWRLGIARMHDSNVNAGPGTETVTLWGLPFTLTPQSRQQADQAAVATASMLHWRKLGERLHWQTEAALTSVQYDRLRGYDLGVFVAETGPVIDAQDGRWLLHSALRHTRVTLGDVANFHATGLAPSLRLRGGTQYDWLLQGVLEERTHDVSEAMSAVIRQLRLAMPWRVLPDWTLEPSLLFRREAAHDPAYSQTQTGGGVALRGQMAGTRFGLEWMSLHARYEAPESWADQARRDRRTTSAITASRPLGAGFYLKASISAQRQASVLELYQTRRTQSMLELSRDF